MRLKIFIYSGPILPPSIGTEATAAAADKLRFPPKLLWVVKENSSKLFSNSSDLICPQRTINLKLNFLFLKKNVWNKVSKKQILKEEKKLSLFFPLVYFGAFLRFRFGLQVFVQPTSSLSNRRRSKGSTRRFVEFYAVGCLFASSQTNTVQ